MVATQRAHTTGNNSQICASGSEVKEIWNQCLTSKMVWKNCWSNMPRTNSRPHGVALSSDHAVCLDYAQKGFSKTRDMSWRSQQTCQLVLFFASASVLLVSACVSCKTLCAKCQHGACQNDLMQGTIFHQIDASLSMFPEINGQTLSCRHATSRLISPWGVSTDNAPQPCIKQLCVVPWVTHGQSFRQFAGCRNVRICI